MDIYAIGVLYEGELGVLGILRNNGKRATKKTGMVAEGYQAYIRISFLLTPRACLLNLFKLDADVCIALAIGWYKHACYTVHTPKPYG